MFDVFESLKSIVKPQEIRIDNNVFKLHYKFTVLVLIGFSVLVTCRQYFGDPIDCIQNDDIPENVLETFCWIHATFTLPGALNKKVGIEIPHPGIDKFKPGDKRTFHKYYQWVCFVLFLQAILFYIPRYLWKMWEGGRVKSLVLGLNLPIVEDKEDKIKMLVDYLVLNKNNHDFYMFQFFICETLNFVNAIGQIYLIDTFLGGEFSTYGLDVVKFTEMEQENRVDPMVRVFPKITKCTFHRYGSSGDVQKHDALCILPLNIINEKIFVFLWFWLVVLAFLSGIILLYRIIIITWPASRYLVIRSRGRLADKKSIHRVMTKFNLGDWFLLMLLCKNLEPLHFKDLMMDLALELKGEEKISGFNKTNAKLLDSR